MSIRDKAFKDYKKGMKYKDIAKKYDVSLSAVKQWATRYWNNKEFNKKRFKEKEITLKKGDQPGSKNTFGNKGGQPGNKNAVGNKGSGAPPFNSNAL